MVVPAVQTESSPMAGGPRDWERWDTAAPGVGRPGAAAEASREPVCQPSLCASRSGQERQCRARDTSPARAAPLSLQARSAERIFVIPVFLNFKQGSSLC